MKEERLVYSAEAEKMVCEGCNKEFPGEPCEPAECFIRNAIAKCKTVEIVLCRECGYWKHMEGGMGDCTNPRFHIEGCAAPTMNYNDFCSCGERKGNDGLL